MPEPLQLIADPKTADQAILMVQNGLAWLDKYAPDRVKHRPVGRWQHVAQALALCPLDLSHLDKCRWIAKHVANAWGVVLEQD